MPANPNGNVKCQAFTQRGNGPQCKNWAIRGGKVCDIHGGRLPTVMQNAARNVARADIERKIGSHLKMYERDIEGQHPIERLLNAVTRSGAVLTLLGEMIYELQELDLYGPNHLNDAMPHVLTVMYGDWMDRHARLCKLAIDANIDERWVRQAEAESERLFTAIGKAMMKIGIPPQQQTAFKSALAMELRNDMGPQTRSAFEPRGEIGAHTSPAPA